MTCVRVVSLRRSSLRWADVSLGTLPARSRNRFERVSKSISKRFPNSKAQRLATQESVTPSMPKRDLGDDRYQAGRVHPCIDLESRYTNRTYVPLNSVDEPPARAAGPTSAKVAIGTSMHGRRAHRRPCSRAIRPAVSGLHKCEGMRMHGTDFADISPTTLADVLGREQVMDIGIRPLWPSMPRVAGAAFTVRC